MQPNLIVLLFADKISLIDFIEVEKPVKFVVNFRDIELTLYNQNDVMNAINNYKAVEKIDSDII